MSIPVVVLSLAALFGGFAAAVADSARAVAERDHAATAAADAAFGALDSCGVQAGCVVPLDCAAPACEVCYSDGVIVARTTRSWSPVLLVGLTPAVAAHYVDVGSIDPVSIALDPCR